MVFAIKTGKRLKEDYGSGIIMNISYEMKNPIWIYHNIFRIIPCHGKKIYSISEILFLSHQRATTRDCPYNTNTTFKSKIIGVTLMVTL
jgi:hypothetical protein